MLQRLTCLLGVGCLWLLFVQIAICEPTAPPAAENEGAEKVSEAQPAGDKATAQAETEEESDSPKHKYIRISRDEDENPLGLETSVVTFKSAGEKHKGVTVDLVGAVHVGDEDYYEKLNKLFETYDVLLYELVAPEGTRIPKGGRKQVGAIGALQGGMSSLLELEHQLEKVDYTKENFVHADMTPEEFAKSMSDRGESFFQIFLKSLGQSTAMQASGKQSMSDADLLFALLSKDRALRLKRLISQQFEDMESAMSIFDGPDGSTLITERNKKCFAVLTKELTKGHKRIGVFYGAGHLADMEQRLNDEFGMQRTGEKWLVAWDLKSPAKPKKETPPANKADKGEDVQDDRDPFDESDQLKKAS